MAPRATYEWRLRDRTLALGETTRVMAVLNVTPDSFSDGGLYATQDAAIAHGLRLLDGELNGEGADILDIGGESTRPGATPVSAQEEQSRVLPVLAELRRLRPGALLSVDTSKSAVARAAVAAGADIVNDVSGLLWDDAMAATCAELQCGVIAMHSRGRPQEWRELPNLSRDAVLPMVRDGLRASLERAIAAGIRRDAVVLDPGFGFGKIGEENYWLLADMSQLAELERPILAGLSRKSFLGPAETRANATLAATVAAVLAGAHIVRVHEVTPTQEAITVADALLRAT